MKKKIILDLIMFIMFILVMKYNLVRDIYHELLGIFIFVLFLYHNGLNLKWIKSVSKMIFTKKTKTDIVIKYVLDVLLWISLIIVMLSGILISKYLFTFSVDFSLCENIHKISSYIFFSIMIMHTLLHINLISKFINSKLHINQTLAKYSLIVIILCSILCFKDLISDKEEVTTDQSTNNSTTTDNSTTTESSNPPVTLAEYLSGLHCSNCHNKCALSAIRCSRGNAPKASATEEYNQLYMDETSYNGSITETVDGIVYSVDNI